MSKIIQKSKNYLLICGISLPFLLSTYQCKPAPEIIETKINNDNDLTQKSTSSSDSDLENPNPPDFSTGFEDLDYWELELELAQEMVRLNKQKKFLEDQNELRQKLKKQSQSHSDSKSDINKSTWQATEGVVDALIRSNIDNNKSKTVKRAASKSVEQRMLSAKYNRRGGAGGMQAQDSSLKPQQMSPDVRLDETGVRNEEQETPSIEQRQVQEHPKTVEEVETVQNKNIIDKLKEILRQ